MNKKKGNRYIMGVLLIICVFSFTIFSLMILYSTGNYRDIIFNITENPIILLLNVFPIFFTTFLVYGVTGRLNLSLLVNYLFYTIIFLINKTKIIYRADTFKLTDLNLGVEAMVMNTKGSYGADRNGIFILFIGLSILILIVRLINIDNLTMSNRLILSLASLALGGIIFPKFYDNEPLYGRIPTIGNIYNDIDSYNSKGTVYSVIHYAFANKIKAPESYDKDKYKEIESRNTNIVAEEIRNSKRPHILWMMGEAFTEIPQEKIFIFDEESDPNKNYKRLKEEAVYHGNLVTHSFAGGTGDTEFDVLTGAMSMNYSPSDSYAFNTIRKRTKSLASIFDSIGYKTRAFHPGFKWFYRRNTVFTRLGFEEKKFLEDIENPINKGGYVAQDQYAEILLEEFKEGIKSEDALFQYSVDIQNHGPYFYDKYKESYPFETTREISDTSKEILGSYFIGVKDIDDSIGKIYDELQKLEEPVIMVFYGDHLPGLGEGMDLFEEIGMSLGNDSFEKEMKTYSTPYIITGNESGRQYLKRENLELEKGQSISVNYLGSVVLDLLNYTGTDNFFTYLSQLRKEFKIISRSYIYKDEKAYRMRELPRDIKEKYEEYLGYQHYRIVE